MKNLSKLAMAIRALKNDFKSAEFNTKSGVKLQVSAMDPSKIQEGDLVTGAEDGTYELGDGTTVVIEDGYVKEVSMPEAPEQVEDEKVEDEVKSEDEEVKESEEDETAKAEESDEEVKEEVIEEEEVKAEETEETEEEEVKSEEVKEDEESIIEAKDKEIEELKAKLKEMEKGQAKDKEDYMSFKSETEEAIKLLAMKVPAGETFLAQSREQKTKAIKAPSNKSVQETIAELRKNK